MSNQQFRLGDIVMKEESGGNAGIVAKDNIGWAYGSFQMNTGGMLPLFLQQSKYADQFAGLQPGSSSFNQRWKEVADQNPDFGDDQYNFIIRNTYAPVSEYAQAKGFDMENPAFQEMMLSSAVQHGGVRKIIDRVASQPGFNEMTPEQKIQLFYSERSTYASNARGVRENPQLVQQIQARYRRESAAVTGLIGGTAMPLNIQSAPPVSPNVDMTQGSNQDAVVDMMNNPQEVADNSFFDVTIKDNTPEVFSGDNLFAAPSNLQQEIIDLAESPADEFSVSGMADFMDVIDDNRQNWRERNIGLSTKIQQAQARLDLGRQRGNVDVNVGFESEQMQVFNPAAANRTTVNQAFASAEADAQQLVNRGTFEFGGFLEIQGGQRVGAFNMGVQENMSSYHNGFERLFREDVDPTFTPEKRRALYDSRFTKQGKTVDMDTWINLASASSEKQFNRYAADYEIGREDQAALAQGGTGTTLAYMAGFVADPLAVIPGMAAEKFALSAVRGARVASLTTKAKTAAAAGRLDEARDAIQEAGRLSSGLRQVRDVAAAGFIGNVALEAALDAADDTRSNTIMDFMLAGTVGAVLSGGAKGAGILFGGRTLDPEMQKALDDTTAALSQYARDNVNLKAQHKAKAVAELGENASPEAIQARLNELEFDHVTEGVRFIATPSSKANVRLKSSARMEEYLRRTRDYDAQVKAIADQAEASVRDQRSKITVLNRERKRIEGLISKLSRGDGNAAKALVKGVKNADDEMALPADRRPEEPVVPDSYDSGEVDPKLLAKLERTMRYLDKDIDPALRAKRKTPASPEDARFDQMASAISWSRRKNAASGSHRTQRGLEKGISDHFEKLGLNVDDVARYGDLINDGKTVTPFTPTLNDVKYVGEARQAKLSLFRQKFADQFGRKVMSEYKGYVDRIVRERAGLVGEQRVPEIDDELIATQQRIDAEIAAMEDVRAGRSDELMAIRDEVVGDIAVSDNAKAAMIRDIYDTSIDAIKDLPPIDKRMRSVMEKEAKLGALTTHSTITHLSNNPVARYLGRIIAESPLAYHTGMNAAVSRFMNARMLRGNVEVKYNASMDAWLKFHGNAPALRVFDKTKRAAFNDRFFSIMEARRTGSDINSPDRHVFDILIEDFEKQTQMWLDAGRRAGLAGYDQLPKSSRGWVPYQVDRDKFLDLVADGGTNQDDYANAMAEALLRGSQFGPEDVAKVKSIARQFVEIQVAKTVMGNTIPASPFSRRGTQRIKEAIAETKGLSEDERVYFTKMFGDPSSEVMARLDRDMNYEYARADGTVMKISDIMVKDPISLINSNTNDLSGELALMEYGLSSELLDTMIDAAATPPRGQVAATPREIDALKQMKAEYFGETYQRGQNGSSTNRAAEFMTTMARVVRLGGLVMAQMSEMSVVMMRFGVSKTLRYLPQFKRLVLEAQEAAKGKSSRQSILGDLDELVGGFGTDYFRHTNSHFNMLSDSPASLSNTEQGTLMRMLSAAENFQGKWTFFHHVISSQERFVAEQLSVDLMSVVAGKGSKRQVSSLKMAGFTDEMIEQLKKDSPFITNTVDGKPQMALGAMRDLELAKSVRANIVRGTGQTIQQKFIGEGASWQHSWLARGLLQFRSYSLLATTKQMGRIYANDGAWALAGQIVGSLSVVAPIQILRAQVASIGMEERERKKFLERALDPGALLRQSLGYVAQLGIGMEAFDIASAFMGDPGARTQVSGRGQNIVSSLNPVAGLLAQQGQGIQEIFTEGDPERLIRALPLSGMPPVRAVLNAVFSAPDTPANPLQKDFSLSDVFGD